jgi:hypothetical protein
VTEILAPNLEFLRRKLELIGDLDQRVAETVRVDAVEGFFAKLTRRRLKRGVFRSVADLQAAINRFVEETNSGPKPFVWTADAKRVLAAVKRGKEKLESIR